MWRYFGRSSVQMPIEKRGWSLVEIVSPCPTNWGMTPPKALEWMRNEMLEYYRLGVFTDCTEEAKKAS